MGLCKVSGLVDRILFNIFLVLVAQSALWQYNSPGLQLVVAAGGGSWEVVVRNAGIASMHTAVTHFGNVVLLDRTNIGPSLLPLPNGICRDNHRDQASKHDCSAHSALYTPGTNDVRPLFIFTDTWCSSGQFRADGTLVQTGGNLDGFSKIRTFTPCASGRDCNWVETETNLQQGRWYASNQQLPDGTAIVVGGRGAFTVEFVPANGRGQYHLPLLTETNDAQNDNFYPFVHLLPTNRLYIFANRDSILYNWEQHITLKRFPTIPGGPRNYPSAGSSVMLPLSAADDWAKAEILICGGSEFGAFLDPRARLPASQTCGRILPLAANPEWAMENMPMRRNMGDMILLPTRQVLIINGAENGSQGWGFASNPVLNPVLYNPALAPGTRFDTLRATNIARVYHSTANLLPDGRILVAGSNSHEFYTFSPLFPTELRIEAFSPPYLAAGARPAIVAVPGALGYGQNFVVEVEYAAVPRGDIELNLLTAPYVTHSYAQGQRLLQLGVGAPVRTAARGYAIATRAPPSAVILPAGYAMLFAVANGVPSEAAWVHVT
ncbi:unnamed protein product [Sphagnum jensenii]|uniref:Glyoxal oxidase n=1 Tax=Sphagnum jensenii TaxID=128206 RepID=A0ABP0X1G6_9BRYO